MLLSFKLYSTCLGYCEEKMRLMFTKIMGGPEREKDKLIKMIVLFFFKYFFVDCSV